MMLFTLNVQCNCNDVIVGSNSIVLCLAIDEVQTMQSYGFSHPCVESPVPSLQIASFKKAIIGSGKVFCTIEEFRDIVYLMLLARRFHYKFKRNSPQHMTVICSAESCP